MASTFLKQVANWYLYGQSNTPANLVDGKLIRPPATEVAMPALDRVDFMSNGGGRFAVGRQFEIVNKFFTEAIAPGIYTKEDLRIKFGMTRIDWEMQHYNYRDETDDYAERTFIYNTMAFQIQDGATFVVEGNGQRRIENYAVIPRTDIQENFDFTSDDGLAIISNPYIRSYMDPSGIGRKVNINFSGAVTTSTYDGDSYFNDLIKMNSWSGFAPLKLLSDVDSLLNDLWTAGITKFLDSNNRPILYGTDENDSLSESALTSSYAPKLFDFKSNGVVLIAGKGNDSLIGGQYNDKLYGGSGIDTLIGGSGNDQFVLATDGSIDTINDPEASDRIVYDGNTVLGIVNNLDNGNYRLGNYALKKQGADLFITSKAGLTSGATIKNFFPANYDNTKDYTSIGITIHGTDNDPSKNHFRPWLNKVSPIVLDLNGDGIKGNPNTNRAIHFDMDNDGFAEETTWISGNDGFLVRDLNGNGKIDNQNELFGDNGTSAYAKLAALDTNGDNRINASDSAFSNLRIWQDANSNGMTDAGELKTLAALNIASFSLKETDATTLGGLTIAGTSSFTRTDGTTGAAADVIFTVDQVNSIYVGSDTSVSPAVDLSTFFMPLSRGYGNMPALHFSMSQNATLKTMVANLSNITIATQFHEVYDRINAIIVEWAGATGIAPTGQASDTNAQKIAVLTQIMGNDLGNISSYSFVDNPYGQFFNTMATRLLVQGPLKQVFTDATYNSASDTLSIMKTSPDDRAGYYQELNSVLQRAALYAPTAGLDKFAYWNAISWALQQDITTHQSGWVYALGRVDIKPTIDLSAGFTTTYSPVYGILDNQAFIYGSAGNDTLSGGLVSTIQAGQGNDTIYLADTDTVIYNIGDGNDTVLVGNAGIARTDSNYIYFGQGITYASLSITLGNNTVSITTPGSGSIVLYGSPLSTLGYIHAFNFADGTTKSIQQINVDVYRGIGTAGNDYLNGTAGNDVMDGMAGNDTIIGSAGSDTINGGTGVDTVSYAQSSAGINIDLKLTTAQVGGDAAGDILSNIENIIGTDYDDTFAGNTSANFFEGWTGYNIVSYASSNVGVTVNLNLGYTPQVSAGDASGDVLNNVWNIVGSNYNDSLTGNDADNFLSGGIGNDTLDGGANTFGSGNDTLNGGSGDDILISGADSDVLTGGIGVDTFAILSSATTSTISDFVQGSDKIDLRDFAGITNFSQIAIVQTAADTKVTYGSVAITLLGVSAVTLNAADFIINPPNGSNIIGTAGNDVLLGTVGNDTVSGLAGNDTITGGAGFDVMNGGDGDDIINSGIGFDTIDGGNGIDIISYAGSAVPYLFIDIGSGNPSLYSEGRTLVDQVVNVENIIGTDQNDIIVGNSTANWLIGRGDSDSIYGLGGNDTIEGTSGSGIGILSGGDGNDTLISSGAGGGFYLIGGAGNDTFVMSGTATGASVQDFVRGQDKIDLSGFPSITNLSDLTFAQTIWNGGADWTISFAGVTILFNQFNTSTLTTNDFIFSSVSPTLTGTSGNDTLTGTVGNDAMDGLAANDVLNGLAGNDTLTGGLGNDTIAGGNGDDVVLSGQGNDVIDGGAGLDTVSYAGLTTGVFADLGSGDPYLFYGLSSVDALSNVENVIGSSGNDSIAGNNGDNLIVAGAGNDGIQAQDGNDTIYGGDGGDGINADDGDDLIFAGLGNDYLNGGNGYDTASYADVGTAITINLAANYGGGGTVGDDYLVNIENAIGSGYNDTISGDAGNNKLDGGAGNDTLNGGAGSDTLTGGDGADVFVIPNLAGAITINDFKVGGADKIDLRDFALLSLLSQMTTLQSGGNTSVTFAHNEGNPITLSLLGFAGTLTASDFLLLPSTAQSVNGTTGADILAGGTAGDSINGNDGNDTITGNGGNDTINGGVGNDLFVSGYGADSIDGGVGLDTATYITAPQAIYVNIGTNPWLFPGTPLDTVVNIENVTGSNYNDSIAGNDSDNFIVAGNGYDGIHALGGNDTIYGGNDNDGINSGDGNDLIIGGPGGDYMDGGAGIDTVSYADSSAAVYVNLLTNGKSGGDATSDSLINIESLIGSTFNDTLFGGNDNSRLEGGAGNDRIGGNGGTDTLVGGAGNDRFVISDSGTATTITDFVHGVDQIDFRSFTAHVLTLPDLVIAQSGANTTITAAHNAGGSMVVTLLGVMASTLTAADFALIGLNGQNITGTGASDVINGGIGEDDISALDGWDAITAGAGNDTIDAGTGNDTIHSGLGNDVIDGGLGLDTVSYASLATGIFVDLGSGNPYLFSGAVAADVIANVENAVGGAGNDSIAGNAGDNSIMGGAGNDGIFALGGNDTIYGEAGNDGINAGAGDDVIIGGIGADYLNGDAGNDTVSYADIGAGVHVNLAAGYGGGGIAGDDTLINIENIIGSGFNDTLVGTVGNNRIDAGSGNDTLTGSAGADILTGGVGAEHFMYNAVTDSGIGANSRDIINDFSRAQGDVIDLSAFTGTFSFLGTAAFSTGGTAPEARYFDDGTNTIVQIDADHDHVTDFEIQINGHTALVSSDFVL